MSSPVTVRAREERDRAGAESLLEANHSRRVARLGELLAPMDHPALVAERDGRIAGLLTYVERGDRCEILTLHAAEQWRRGFRLAELRPGGVEEARRTLKPEIPRTGAHGIPLREELVLEKVLG